MDKNYRKTIPEPLLFIHTVTTPVETNGSMTKFDSRKKTNTEFIISKKTENINQLVLKKLNNIIQMVSLGYSVNCLIETKDLFQIEGIPITINDDILTLKFEDEEKKIVLNNINDVIILKI